MTVPHAPFQPVEPEVLRRRRHRLCRQQAGKHQKRPGGGPAVRVLCAGQGKRFDPSRPRAGELVHRGFHLLHSGRAGQRSKQHCRGRRSGKGSAKKVSRSTGRRNPNARHFQERSALPDGGGRGEGALGLGSGAGNLAHAVAHDPEHRQCGRLQATTS